MFRPNFKWMKFAAFEGLTKATCSVIHKYIGISGGAFGPMVVVTGIIGFVQMIGGGIVVFFRGDKIYPGLKPVIGSCLFGIFAVFMTALSLYVFTFEGADIGIKTFIGTMSIIPGIFIDRIFFKQPLLARQWCGVGVFLVSGYIILGLPNIETMLSLPLWIWLSFAVALAAAVNEGITRGISLAPATSPFSNNFWVGLTTILSSGLVLLFLDIKASVLSISQFILFGSIVTGLLVIAMISFKLLTYKHGGNIAFKKFIMMGTFLSTSVLAGALFHHEPLSIGKFIGIFGFFFAFPLMDKETWNATKNILKK